MDSLSEMSDPRKPYELKINHMIGKTEEQISQEFGNSKKEVIPKTPLDIKVNSIVQKARKDAQKSSHTSIYCCRRIKKLKT